MAWIKVEMVRLSSRGKMRKFFCSTFSFFRSLLYNFTAIPWACFRPKNVKPAQWPAPSAKRNNSNSKRIIYNWSNLTLPGLNYSNLTYFILPDIIWPYLTLLERTYLPISCPAGAHPVPLNLNFIFNFYITLSWIGLYYQNFESLRWLNWEVILL